ncbi:neurexin-3a-like isoform 2-T2 [Menidia menidia]
MELACLCVGLQLVLGACLGLEFPGAPGQWARYLRWDASTRGDLSFQLRTESPEALLLYFDDGGYCDFLQLAVADGRLQLRFSIDCAEASVASERRVDDGGWHAATLSRQGPRTALVLDGRARAHEVRPQRSFMRIVSDLFLGGVPADVRSAALTLPAVRSLPPFRGAITDLSYGGAPPRLLGSLKVPLESEGWCTENPCENGGACSVLDGEPVCDCSKTEYRGRFCSEEVSPGVPGLAHMMAEPAKSKAREENMATFRGSEYFCYDLSQNPIQSSSDEITLSF